MNGRGGREHGMEGGKEMRGSHERKGKGKEGRGGARRKGRLRGWGGGRIGLHYYLT